MKPWLLCLSFLGLSFFLAGNLFAVDVPTTNLPTVASRLTSAREAIQSSDWSRALAELQVAVRQEPGNADVHNLMGYCYRKQAPPNMPKAFEHYNTALQLAPRHRAAHEYIGEAYLMDKKLAAAERHLAELERICGNKICEEYADLARAIADYKAHTR